MLIKRAGLAMGIFFLYLIIEQFVVSLGRNKYKLDWVDYLPEEVPTCSDPSTVCPQKNSAPGNNALWEKNIFLNIELLPFHIYNPLYFDYKLAVSEIGSLRQIKALIAQKLKFR